MNKRTAIMIAGGTLAAGAMALAGMQAVAATSDDDGTEIPITGEALDRASTVALDHTGGGRVTETEVGDEEGYYEVEVTREDGSQVDVHLDERFNVLGVEDDGQGDADDAD